MKMPRYSAAGLAIEPVEPGDIPAFMEMLGEMAEFLRGSKNFVTTPEELSQALFSSPPVMEAIIGRQEGEVAGFVNWYTCTASPLAPWLPGPAEFANR